jgi:thiol-disulfide isomerase/thioredoxin
LSKAEKPEAKARRRSTLYEDLKNKDNAVVLFYATWCPFSQRFLPIFEEYSRNNPEDCIRIIVDEEPDICEEYAIDYYPTVIIFKKGKVHKRLDAEPGVGLNKKQLKDITEKL